MDFAQHLKCYTRLLDHGIIRKFLRRDPCAVLADKYHLVIVFQYFMRAEFKEDEYTPRNFFLALSLSHDIYDEITPPKRAIIKYCLAKENDITKEAKKKYQWDKIKLYKRMDFKGFIKKKICHNLFTLIPHKSIMRGRKEVHVGIFPVNPKTLCKKCNMPRHKDENSKENDLDSNDNTAKSEKTEENCPSEPNSLSRSVSECSNIEWDKIQGKSCSPNDISLKSRNVSESPSMELDPDEWFG